MEFKKNYVLEICQGPTIYVNPSDYFSKEEWLEINEEDQREFLLNEGWNFIEQNFTVQILED